MHNMKAALLLLIYTYTAGKRGELLTELSWRIKQIARYIQHFPKVNNLRVMHIFSGHNGIALRIDGQQDC